MTTLSNVIIALAVITQTAYAREIASNLQIIKTPANMTYDELLYIFESRQGAIKAKPKNLTPCAKAILGCCHENKMNEACSVALKCGAYFFDDNPCDDKFILDALRAAKVFYEQFNNIA